MLYPFESFLGSLVEVDFWRHEELLAKDNFVLVWEFIGGFIGELVVGDRLVLALKEVAVLMLDFSHDFLNNPVLTM